MSRMSGQLYAVGTGGAKRNHEAAIIDQAGKTVRKAFRFANTHTGYNKLVQTVQELDESVVFGMEATGHYWLALYTHLRNDGFTVHVINPIQSDALRGMYIRKTKNDAIDAILIADVIRFGRYCETSVEPGDLQALRELCRQRFYIVDMVSDFKRKVIALLDQVFPEYEKLFSDTFGSSSLELLSANTTPEEILAVDTDKLVELLNTASHGRFGSDKAMEVQDAAKNSFGIVMGSFSFALIIRQYVEQIRSLENSIAVFDAFEVSTAAKLAAYAGIDPAVRQSGDFNGSRMKMSKRGSPYLRRAIWLASTVAAFKDPAIHALYERKRAEGKDHMTTIGHVCRKMVSIIFAVLRDNSPYIPAAIP